MPRRSLLDRATFAVLAVLFSLDAACFPVLFVATFGVCGALDRAAAVFFADFFARILEFDFTAGFVFAFVFAFFFDAGFDLRFNEGDDLEAAPAGFFVAAVFFRLDFFFGEVDFFTDAFEAPSDCRAVEAFRRLLAFFALFDFVFDRERVEAEALALPEARECFRFFFVAPELDFRPDDDFFATDPHLVYKSRRSHWTGV